MSTRLVTPVVLTIGALVACHEPYSNEDLQFLYESVPRDIEIVVPTENGSTGVGEPGGPPPEGTAQFYGDARRTADTINGEVLALLTWVDDVVAEPPSRRVNDQRVWGPLPTETGILLTVVADRVETSTVFRATSTSTPAATDVFFDFALLAQQPGENEGQLVFSGRQATDSNGTQGLLFLDLQAFQAVDPTSDGEGEVVVAFDARFGQQTVELLLGAFSQGTDPAAAWRHTQDDDGSGSFVFYLREDVDPTSPALELWVVAARWLPDGQGRADALITAGDLTLPLFASECWNAGFRRTYLLSNIPDPAYFPEGGLDACAVGLRTAQFPE